MIFGDSIINMSYKVQQYDIKEIQAVLLEILLEIDRVCKKNDIKYSLGFGTLLGAIRHKDFIPWDDDLDITMLRADYDRFIEACKTDLNSNYFLSYFDSENEYPYDFGKVVKNNTLYEEIGAKYRNIHKGVYVDIFPLDNVNIRTYSFQHYLFSFFRRARWRSIDKKTMPRKEWNNSDMKKVTRIAVPIAWLGNNNLHYILEKIMRLHNRKRTKYVYTMCHPNGDKWLFERKWFDNYEYKEFSGFLFPCAKGFDGILKQAYGDYMKMPPPEMRLPSHDIVEINLNVNERMI